MVEFAVLVHFKAPNRKNSGNLANSRRFINCYWISLLVSFSFSFIVYPFFPQHNLIVTAFNSFINQHFQHNNDIFSVPRNDIAVQSARKITRNNNFMCVLSIHSALCVVNKVNTRTNVKHASISKMWRVWEWVKQKVGIVT